MAGEENEQVEPTGGSEATPDIGNSLSQGIFKGTDFAKEWENIQSNKPDNGEAVETSKDPLEAALANVATEVSEGAEAAGAETQESAQASEPTADSNEDSAFIESPLFGGKKTLGDEATEATAEPSFVEPEIENIDQVNTYLKDTFGVEGFSALSERLENSKKLEEDYSSAKGQIDSFTTLFENMDSELYQAIDAYAKGSDWRAALNSPAIDFSKDASSVDSKKLVEAFAPGKISDEDWEEYSDPDGDPTVKRLVDSVIETSKAAFTNKKNEKQQSAQLEVEKQQKRNEMFSTSLDKSRENLKSGYSSIDPSALAQIDDVFKKQGIASLFFNNDGSVKEDAYETVAMAKFGKDLIKQFETIAMRKAETKVNQEMLSRTPVSPKEDRGTSSVETPTGVRPEVKEAVEKMMAQTGKRHF